MRYLALFLCFIAVSFAVAASAFAADMKPLFATVDLDRGESKTVTLPGETEMTVKLIGIKEHRDGVRGVLRGADVTVEVNGQRGTIGCATYHLPVELGGVRIDCPVIKGYVDGSSNGNVWAIDGDARLRVWPKTGPFIRPGTFGYPVEQCWGAAGTQFDNEIGDADLTNSSKKVYYHQGFDFGGSDRLTPVVAATDGVVVSARGKSLKKLPKVIKPRYDVVYLRDGRGWYYRYSHLDSIDKKVQVGKRVVLGQKLGVLGKEGASGGWAHLHFELIRKQNNGKYGSDSVYAFLHQVYQAAHDDWPVVAVAGPRTLVEVGKPVTFDGSRSWSKFGRKGIVKYEWTFDDGTTATGPKVEHVFRKGGCYGPILKVTDAKRNIDYDFAVVKVADPKVSPKKRCYLHASYWPTPNQKIRPGQEVTFLVRSFRFTPKVGDETWDFGDGTPKETTRSDGCIDYHTKPGYATIKHRFEKPGHYIVTVRRQNSNGQTAVDRLDVRVEAE
ncbi:MAG: PKD domain-containing protein [Planctomycetia bacterium]|jgi:murein DD-endopeptidase MepM/ murein hydrolase activator NlpD